MDAFFDLNLVLILAILSLGMLVAFLRLARGPSLADRVIALDLISITGVGLSAAAAVASGIRVFLDVAILLALIAFIGTAAFASYIERRDRGWP